MTRLEALEELQSKINSFGEYIQGGFLKNKGAPHPVDIATDFTGSEELDNLATGCDDVLAWVFSEIEKEQVIADEELPDEQFPGHAVGQ